MKLQTFQLKGTVCAVSTTDRVMRISVDVGQDIPVSFRFRLDDESDRGVILPFIVNGRGLSDPSALVGAPLTIKVIQPEVDWYLAPSLVCVGLVL